MTKQDVIKMAREAAKMYPGYSEDDPDMDGEELKFFTRFARIVANAEREKCAKVCEEEVIFPAGHNGQYEGYGNVVTTRSGKDCAVVIRSMEGV